MWLPGKPANGGNTGGGLVVVSGIVNGASVTGAPGPEEKKIKKKMTFKDAQLRYFSFILFAKNKVSACFVLVLACSQIFATARMLGLSLKSAPLSEIS